MVGRLWSWVLDFAPVRDALRREVRAAVDLAMDAAEHARVRQRRRHRTELDRLTDELAGALNQVDELTANNADLLGANASLRGELAQAREAASRELADRDELVRRVIHEQQDAEARLWQGATTDAFCCQSCWAFWFLTTRPDGRAGTVRGPFGRHDPECPVCADPLVALPAAKSVAFRKNAQHRISRPVLDDLGEPRAETAVASAELAAIADGLAGLPRVASRTIAWVAANLTVAPELPATALGEIAKRTTRSVPLDGIVAGLRAFVDARRADPPRETAT